MYTPLTRAEYVELMGVKDDAMYLCRLRTSQVARSFEVLEGRFTDYRPEREYPDFAFKILFTWDRSAEDVRNSLFGWLDGRKTMGNRSLKFCANLCYRPVILGIPKPLGYCIIYNLQIPLDLI